METRSKKRARIARELGVPLGFDDWCRRKSIEMREKRTAEVKRDAWIVEAMDKALDTWEKTMMERRRIIEDTTRR